MVGNIGPGFAGIAAAQAHVHVTKMTFSHPAVLMILWQGGHGSFLLCCQGPRSSRFFPSVSWMFGRNLGEARFRNPTKHLGRVQQAYMWHMRLSFSNCRQFRLMTHPFGTFQNWRTEGWSSEGRPDWDFGVAKRAVCLPCSTRNPSSSGHLFDHQ